jgi:diguanylate cyclase (GGDEF)-like protein
VRFFALANAATAPISSAALVISIKRYLSNNDAVPALLQVVRLLVQGIGEHAVFADAGESSVFRDRIKGVVQSLGDDSDPEELLKKATTVIGALEEHNLRASRHWGLQAIELQHMVQMLTSTVRTISASSDVNGARLGEIEQQVTTASQIDDVRMIKTRLSECLAEIRKESERQRQETSDTIVQLNQGLEQVRTHSVGVEQQANDAITGLRRRQEAEGALTRSSQGTAQTYAAVMVVDRLQALNVRFGREVGDAVLAAFARMVQGNLKESDQLFRWSGPALLAIVPRTSSIERVRIEIGTIAETRLEHNIETPSRSIMLPISARWSVFPMMAAPRLMFQKIDAFAAGPGVRE